MLNFRKKKTKNKILIKSVVTADLKLELRRMGKVRHDRAELISLGGWGGWGCVRVLEGI